MVLRPTPLAVAAFALLIAAVLALTAVPAKAAKAGRARDCAHAELVPKPGNLRIVRTAVLCLHNRVRAQHGLPDLRPSRKLRRAASRHAARMARDDFFSHVGPGGRSFIDRIRRTGYGGRGGWSLGENIAWAAGPAATAREIHQMWMGSDGHRANILSGEFREVGLGVAVGIPLPQDAPGATFTADFGVRR